MGKREESDRQPERDMERKGRGKKKNKWEKDRKKCETIKRGMGIERE